VDPSSVLRWMLDSGFPHHSSCNSSLFTELRSCTRDYLLVIVSFTLDLLWLLCEMSSFVLLLCSI
jgi:hypothetical protein